MASGWLERLEIRALAKNSWRNQAASGLYESHFEHAAITSKATALYMRIAQFPRITRLWTLRT
jgi:hypothetical protein